MMSVYHPGSGHTSSTVISGRTPKKSSVSFGWRYRSRARSASERCGSARMLSSAWAVASRVLVTAQPAINTAAANSASAGFCLANMFALSCRARLSPARIIPRATRKKPRARAGVSLRSEALHVGAASAPERAAALAGALGAFLRLIHAQWPATHVEAVQRLDRLLRLARGHIDERKTARLARFPVIDQLYRLHLAVTLKQGFDVLLGGTEGQIAHIDRLHPEVSLGWKQHT